MKPVDLSNALRGIHPKATAWAQTKESEALASGVPLSEDQSRLAASVGVVHPERVRVLVVSEMPYPEDPELALVADAVGMPGPDTAGLTLGYAVFVRTGFLSARLMAHELRHVHQYETAGSVGAFLAGYLEQIARVGYYDAPLEQDARNHEAFADGATDD